MDRRFVVYENNSHSGRGEAVFSYGQHVNQKNNIMERDIACFILQMEKSQNRPINAMLVVKYLIVTKKRYNTFMELIDYIFHRNDFKPLIAPLPAHVEEKETHKTEILQDVNDLRMEV